MDVAEIMQQIEEMNRGIASLLVQREKIDGQIELRKNQRNHLLESLDNEKFSETGTSNQSATIDEKPNAQSVPSNKLHKFIIAGNEDGINESEENSNLHCGGKIDG